MIHKEKPKDQVNEIKDICNKWMINTCLSCGNKMIEGICPYCECTSQNNDFVGMTRISWIVGELICMTGCKTKDD